MPTSLDPNGCPADNFCALAELGARPCGTIAKHMPPMVAAESLCPRALAGGIEATRASLAAAAEGPSPSRAVSRRHGELAGLLLEQSIAFGVSEVASSADEPGDHIRHILAESYLQLQEVFDVLLFSVHRPVFTARVAGEAPGLEALREIRKGLINLYDFLQATPVHDLLAEHIAEAENDDLPHTQCLRTEGERKNLEAKLIGFMCAARNGFVLYPASPREGRAYGEVSAQNHDAYSLHDNQKTAYRLSARSLSDVRSRRKANPADERVHFINMNAVLDGAVRSLTARYQEYQGLRYQPPRLSSVGRWLRDQLDGKRLEPLELRLLDAMGERFQQVINDSAPELPSYKPLRDQWEVLPAAVLADSAYRTIEADVSRKAFESMELYLRCSQRAPDRYQLQELIGNMRPSQNAKVRTICVGAYIDLARNASPDASYSARVLAAAEALARNVTERDPDKIKTSEFEHRFRCGLQLAYMGKYRKALLGEPTGIDDERKLYLQLLELGKETIEPCYSIPSEQDLRSARGAQFEISIHLLHARRNLADGSISTAMWPSLPREDAPHNSEFAYRTGWDAGMNSTFLDQGPGLRRLQLKTIDDGNLYAPAITIVAGDRDLGTKSTADIINNAIQELHGTTRRSKEVARNRLRAYDKAFFQKVEY